MRGVDRQSVDQRQPEPGGVVREWLLPLAIAICVAGAGVTGILWWVQENRPPIRPTTAQRIPLEDGLMNFPHAGGGSASGASNASASNASNASAVHEPPAQLTAGMAPAKAALALGNWYYDHEQWERAIAQYQKAIASGIDNANIRTDLGNCWRFYKQPQKALQQYQMAQKQEPRHEQSFFNQGGLYRFSLHNPKKAIAIWREYLRRFPKGQSVDDARRLIRETQAEMTSGAKGAGTNP